MGSARAGGAETQVQPKSRHVQSVQAGDLGGRKKCKMTNCCLEKSEGGKSSEKWTGGPNSDGQSGKLEADIDPARWGPTCVNAFKTKIGSLCQIPKQL